MKLFIAILFDKQTQRFIYSQYSQYITSDNIKFINFERPEKLHITIKYIGETKENLIDEIYKILDNAVKYLNIKRFQLQIGGEFGVFPNIHNPRVFWLSAQDDTNNLANLFELLNNEFVKFEIKKEARNFTPHITLARIKNPKAYAKLKISDNLPIQTKKIKVDSIAIMESIKGEYKLLKKCELAND
ncbi:MAG TPA: RNA 2',3'-cyclic phosphodiesterase [bacterium]|nr:RNA 2',3'-cyclic phosphodiesterase [bacterium]